MFDKYAGIFLLAVFIASCSQIILKASANKVHKNRLREYLNLPVIGSYIMLFVSSFLAIIAYQRIELKQGSILDATGYIWVLLLSWFVLHEEITSNKIVGTLLIIIGILIFSY